MAGPVRLPINLDALQGYLETSVPEIKTPLSIKQFGDGQSNPTYQLTGADGNRYVLRKKPPGPLLSQTAHNVEREYRVLRALEKTDVPVPKVYCLCTDPSIIGTIFYVMEFLDGRIFIQQSLPGVSPSERTSMWRSAVETLARIHRVDYKGLGLGSLEKPDKFYVRQIRTFKSLSIQQAQATDKETGAPVAKVPHFNEMTEAFEVAQYQPEDRKTLIHGDYMMHNLLFHKTEPYVIGVLDWEMTTVGHPLADLVNVTAPFVSATASTHVGANKDSAAFKPGATQGLPTREQCVEWYAQVARWDPSEDLAWGDAFSAFRTAVVMQGIAARYALRQNSSVRASEFDLQVAPNSHWAWELVQRFKKQRGKRTLSPRKRGTPSSGRL
ncbi:aminoglycoside phosphotransferase [Cladophialophora psammophila CBS 110553]|uniref:Aminoglycoside phosphotransferase n=1 Tax=Cladophialophora psammophila CBS 110553 TaxID=1182543 RepID=W9XYM0_9EURO|nr:aminoglycoside phosphotransferase [Cladophialophora psammophila CBS 110553]EXJ75354.1 aminoglycoside phosphotransferase [Cladophialophora psammophila CBS 110553]